MKIVERRIESIAAVVECCSGLVVSVDAGAQGVLEVRDSGAVNEVVEVLLWSALWLQNSFYRGVSQYCKGRIESCEGSVDIVE